MARPATNLSARLAKLAQAKARAEKLPQRATLTSKPMSEMIGVTWNVLRDWCSDIDGFETSGAFVRGGNGIEWEFKPRKTIAFLAKHFETRKTAQTKKSRAITKAVGVTLPDDEAPSLAETKDLVGLTLAVVAAMERQGLFVLASDAADFLAGYNRRVVEGIMGVKTKIDPNGNLPAQVRADVDGYLRAVATEVDLAAQQAIGDYRARAEQAGTGRTGPAAI